MTVLRTVLGILAFLPGLWMSFDGSRALVRGDYVTPSGGPRAGQLGPWAPLVSAVGVPPRSTAMKVTFIVFGLAWLASGVAFLSRRPAGGRLLAGTAAATLWYAPVGTAVALVELGGLAVLRARGDQQR